MGTPHSPKLLYSWNLTIRLFSVIYKDTRCGGWFYPSAEMQSVYSTALADWATGHSLWGVLSICRDTVCVFYSPSRLGLWTLVVCVCVCRGSYPSAETQSVYSAAPADWATGHSLWGVLSICKDTVGVFYSPSRLGHRTLVVCRGVLSICRDTVGVFYSPSQLGNFYAGWYFCW